MWHSVAQRRNKVIENLWWVIWFSLYVRTAWKRLILLQLRFSLEAISCQSAFKSSGAGLRLDLFVDTALCSKGMFEISMKGGMWAADMTWPDLNILSEITPLPGGLRQTYFSLLYFVVLVLKSVPTSHFLQYSSLLCLHIIVTPPRLSDLLQPVHQKSFAFYRYIDFSISSNNLLWWFFF